MGPHLLEQVQPLVGRKRLDQLLLGGGQNALQADHEEITKQVGVNILGSPAGLERTLYALPHDAKEEFLPS